MRIWLVLLLVACAPRVDGPTEQQRSIDRNDADRLTAQLAALPGVVRAEITLRRSARDPLSMIVPATPVLSAVVIVDDKADRTAITEATGKLARAAAPGLEPTIVVEVGAVRPTLAKVGPFTVEESSKGALKAALAIVLALIAGLAGWIAYARRGSSAQ